MYKPQTIYKWKSYGIICDDFDKLYEYHMSINNCELCNVEFDDSFKNQRCLDHDHHTGLYRKTLCRSCNAHYEVARRKYKKHTTEHMWISNRKTFNKRYNKYYFSWAYQRRIDGKYKNRSFKTLSKAIAYSFIMLLKEPF